MTDQLLKDFDQIRELPSYCFSERDNLVKQGLLIPTKQNEIRKVLTKQTQALNTVGEMLCLTIAPTLKCNFRCYYCFEFGANVDESEPFPIDDVVAFVLTKLSEHPYKKLYIKWFGGEPLLKVDIIDKLASIIKLFCENNSIHFYSSIITNGYYLSPQNVEMLILKSNLRGIQVSLDGDSHNYCEAKATTEDAYNRVIQNIIDASKLVEIHVRFNVSRTNIDGVKKAVNQIKQKSNEAGCVENIHFDFARVRDYSSLTKENRVQAYSICHTAITDSLGVLFQRLKDEHSDLAPIKVRRTYCMERSASFFTIGPNGDLYKCPHFLGRKENIVGNVAYGEFYNDFWDSFVNHLDHPKKCLACSMFAVCFSGCPQQRTCNNDGDCLDCKDEILNNVIQHCIMYNKRKE